MKTNTKKLLSLLLALMMMLSVVPFYASAEAVALTTNNVTEWPTAEYLNADGKMYFGQKVGDAIALVGGKVEYNGVEVPGHFEHIDPNQVTTSPGTTRVNMKFVPDDESAYTGFEKKRSGDVKYEISTTTPLYVDETNDPVVATEVETGATLSTSILSGGKMYNPYNADETRISTATWIWADSTAVVNESGYYEAVFYPVGYTRTTEWVLVRVKGDTSEVKMATSIAELPIASTAKVGDSLSSIELIGGKVVGMNGEEVSGTFAFEGDSVFNNIGTSMPTIIFTPDDERYSASTAIISITVTKGNYKFVNENGEVVVPELTLPYGTTFDTGEALGVALKFMIKDRALLTGADVANISFPDHAEDEIAPVGTNTYNVRIRPNHSGNSNYNETDLQFILTIEPVAVEMKLSMSIDKEQTININKVNSYDPYPQGTFDIYVDGALYMEDVKGSFPFDPGKSGSYEIKLVYNPVENDPCVVEEKTTTWTETYHRNLTRGNLVMGGTPTVMYGKEVTLTANMLPENFGGWKITDANGNEVTLEGAVMEGRDITFTMPDYDITVEAIDKSEASSGTTGGIDDIFGDLGDLTEGDSDNAIINIFNNIIAFFKNIIVTITNLFRSIGDNT